MSQKLGKNFQFIIIIEIYENNKKRVVFSETIT